jgi:hypothetical protein
VFVSVRIHIAGRGIPGVDAGYPKLRQGEQLFLGGEPVSVDVLPDTELRKDRIACVDLAVRVAIQIRQGRKAVGCCLPALQQSVIPKQLRSVVDDPVSIDISDEKTIVCRRPAR